MRRDDAAGLRIAVVGSGVSGLAAAWLLSQRHDVTLYERDNRIGGHAHTVDVRHAGGTTAVDTGFIVYNPRNYPNLVALFAHLGVETAKSDMSFAVSLDDGDLEYGGGSLAALLAQPANALRPRFLAMLRDLIRFYRTAPSLLDEAADPTLTLGAYLDRHRYGRAFRRDHLLPMAGAIWSAAPDAMLEYPAAAFVRFFVNHGLLELGHRPEWRTVEGGSRSYVARLAETLGGRVRRQTPVAAVRRLPGGAEVVVAGATPERYDHVVLATHSDEALALLVDATPRERTLLDAIRYTPNTAVLHTDASLMPRRRGVWSSWNYIGRSDGGRADPCVTYWMNRLQPLVGAPDLFVTLNPEREPAEQLVKWRGTYAHPAFDIAAHAAQRAIQAGQGRDNTWFCGAWLGSGFHEDGLVSGIAVASALGVHPPWAESGSRSAPAAVREFVS